jgi:type II secretory pathway component PulM
MIRSMISVIGIAVVIVVGTLLWRPHSHSIELTTAAMPPLVQLHAMAGVEKLPVQDIDDQSLIYPTPTK